MGPIISVILGAICGVVIFALLIRAIVPRLPLSATWRARVWRWAVALTIVYALMMLIVALTMGTSGQ
jgi:hypothetical protein